MKSVGADKITDDAVSIPGTSVGCKKRVTKIRADKSGICSNDAKMIFSRKGMKEGLRENDDLKTFVFDK